MGKSKPRHKNYRWHNKSKPTGIVRDNEESELTSLTSKELIIHNIIEEIQSSNTEETICGLQSLVNLTENAESVKAIMKCKVLKIVAPLLIDKSSEVRNFTAGALRNLSASGAPEVCERLVKEDIMTPLVALLHQYEDWNPESAKEEDTDTLLQVVNILWNLCEMDETALKYFNSANLLSILLRCLDYKTVGIDLSIAVCQCLNSVSEDNTDVITVLHNHESDLLGLLTVTPTTHKLLWLKALTAGIVVNLNPSSSWLVAVLSVLQEVLGTDLRAQVSQLSSVLPLDASTQLTDDGQAQLTEIIALVEAQTMAFEILTNLTVSQDDEMDLESEDSLSDDGDEVNDWNEANDTHPLAINPEIHEGLEKFKLVAAVFSSIVPLPENVLEIVINCPSSRSLTKKLLRMKSRVFMCVNNLVSVVDLELLGGTDHLFSQVKQISDQKLCVNVHKETSDYRSELVEASSAAVRAIMLRLASEKFTGGAMSLDDIEAIFNAGQYPEPRVQANVLRIVGIMGMLCIQEHTLLIKLSTYLLEAAEKHAPMWVMAEALDCLMDMFAEDSTDTVALQVNLVSRLQALAPQFKSRMRQEKRSLGEHYPIVSTVMTNLTPFIKYKGSRIAGMTKNT